MSARNKLAFALDVATLAEANVWLDRLHESVGVFKVGLELFIAEGPHIIEAVHKRGADCFLDLKLHDIPQTMARATERVMSLGVRFVTVHAAAGPTALEAVTNVTHQSETMPLAVTVLTSADTATLQAINVSASASEQALHLLRMSMSVGVRGFVCAAPDLKVLRAEANDAFFVTPGIRPAGIAAHDQRRVATPAEAIAAGSNLLVIGRAIRDAANPTKTAEAILREIEGSHHEVEERS